MTVIHLKQAVKFRQKQAVKKEFDNWTTSDLINYIFDLRREIENLNSKLKSNIFSTQNNYHNSVVIPKKEQEYDQALSFPSKIVFLLEQNQKPLTSAELNNLLLKYDKTYKKFKTPKKTLASILSRAFKTKRILNFKRAGIKELLIVLPEWLKNDGNLKEF